MEPFARMTILGFAARTGVLPFRGAGDVEWNGSRASLPISGSSPVKSPQSQCDAASELGELGGDFPKRSARTARDATDKQGDDAEHPSELQLDEYHHAFLKGLFYVGVLQLQSLVVLGVLVLLGYESSVERNATRFESWNMLWKYSAAPLLILLSLPVTGLLIHAINKLTLGVYFGFQMAGALLATFCGILLVAASLGFNKPGQQHEDFGGIVGVLIGAVLIWFVFLAGFLQASWVWHRENGGAESPQGRKPRRKERGYGTTSGGIAVEQEDGFEGLLGGG